jgi:D-alanyl-lipoteichoic acid acyltransferase DltB (MBOAT superfamily)
MGAGQRLVVLDAAAEQPMSFIEIEFLFFLPIVWIVHWLMPRKTIPQNAVLLVSSYLFFAAWHWKVLGLVVGGTAVDYVVSRYLSRTEETAGAGRVRRIALAISLALSLGALAFFKYEAFFATSANALLMGLGFSSSLPVLKLALPLGISFYTLQRVGYVLDIYWGRHPPARNLLEFAVFTSFFPQVTAGPISRASELLPQLQGPRHLTADLLARGTGAFLLGYVLKGWAGDSIGNDLVNPVFAGSGEFGVMAHWAGAAGYALQVFGDFAGYSLMAIGVGRLFGIELPVNFNFPFLSRSLPELWRRWHITLNRWLFDYIFTPLTTSRGWFRGRVDTALLLTFLASGLWHGANWTFVLWGALHGLGMVVHRNWDEMYRGWCRRNRAWVKRRQSRWYAALAWSTTIGFFVFTLVPFRSPDIGAAADYFSQMIGSAGGAFPPIGGNVSLAMLTIIGYHLLELKPLSWVRERYFALPAVVRGMAYGAVIVFLMIETPVASGTFIYQQF